MKHKILTTAGAIVIVAAVFIAGMSYGTRVAVSPTIVSEKNTANLMVDSGTGKILTYDNLIVSTSTTVFELLKTAEKNGLKLEYKDYGGDLGVFIQSINGSAGTQNIWWQFWVDGVYSQKGVSGVIVHPGDVVEFKLTKEQQ